MSLYICYRVSRGCKTGDILALFHEAYSLEEGKLKLAESARGVGPGEVGAGWEEERLFASPSGRGPKQG